MFSTVKKVSFYSPVLYTTKVLLMCLVLGYVVVYNFAYRGIHLETSVVNPSVDYRIRPPTGPCKNPWKWRAACGRLRNEFADLPYCKVSPKPATLSLKRDCVENKLQGISEGPNTIFIPTWIQTWQGPFSDTVVEKFLNKTMNSAGPANTTLWMEPEATLVSDEFVANAEMLIMELEHRLEFPGGDINISGWRMKGWYRKDEGRGRPLEMSEGATAAEARHKKTHQINKSGPSRKDLMLMPSDMDLSGVLNPRIVREDFDAIIKVSLEGVLQLANIDMDAKATEAQIWRSCGTKIILDIDYSNTDSWPGLKITPWSSPTPWYAVSARHEVSTCPSWYKYHGEGTFTRTRGIRLEIVQRVFLLQWSPFRAVVGLSTVLTLVGTMVRLLEMYLENCTTWYKDLKYERRRRPQDEETGKEGGDEEDAKEEQKGSPKAGQAEERQAEARTGHKEPGVSSAGKEV